MLYRAEMQDEKAGLLICILDLSLVNLIMTTLTVNIQNKKDLSVLQEILDRFGMDYAVDEEYDFSKEEIEVLVKRKQDYLDGKTTARDWNAIKEELDRKYNL